MNTTKPDTTPDDGTRNKAKTTGAILPKKFDGSKRKASSGNEVPVLQETASWAAKRMEELKTLGKRLFVHLAMVVTAITVVLSADSMLAGLCVYVGGICILARGIAGTPAWLIPAGTGILQTVILVLFGFSFPQALFWGGMQAWIQRIVQKRFRMGSEWGMALFLFPLTVYLLPSMPLATLAASFAGMLAVGVSISRAVERKQSLDARAETLLKAGPPEPERVVEYRASLADFSKKIPSLPEQVQNVAQSIVAHTNDILNDMVADQRDLEQGHRFLNRYFKAAHSVVDSHICLAREKIITPEMTEALAKSEETLVRLDEVFAKEHSRMLKNDVTDFSADLAVIDTLLKMDGR
jgi:5-bromo-4-chloroindolyl phosphate hydrolysis protein.